MRIYSFAHLRRTQNPTTGVGKHIINMTRGLHAQAGVDLKVLAVRSELDATGQIGAESMLAGLPVASVPGPRALLEQAWRWTGHPVVDRWAPDADWIYSPAEAYIPTRQARLAVTVHDMAAFEPDLPWSDTPENLSFRRRWKRLFDQLIRHADLFLTVSQFTKRRMVELLSIAPSKIAVVGNGVEARYFNAENKGVGDPFSYLLLVGGLIQRKGADDILLLAGELKRRGSALRIKVAGLTQPRYLKPMADAGNIDNLGFIPDESLLPLLQNAVAVLMLSRYEGFGIPALEAMACGTPAIVSPYASLPEIVGNAGLIVDPHDTPTIADLAMNLANNLPLRDEISWRSRAHAEHYLWDACVSRLVDALQNA